MATRLNVAAAALVAFATIPLVTMTAQGPTARQAAGEVLVKYRPTVSVARRNAIAAGRSATILRRAQRLDVDFIRLPPGQDVAAAIAAFRSMAEIELVQPNYIRRAVASSPPDDPFWSLGFMWGLERIQAQPAWELTTGDPSVVVAAIDTGVEYTHPDLSPNMWRNPAEIAGNGIDDDGNGYADDVFGIDTANHDADPMDDNGHGTHTAGTIGARGNNGTGVTGVGWRASILACKFLDAQGNGTDAGAIECFDYLLVLKQRGINIRVTNNSWGAPREDTPAAVLQATIDAVGATDILNVFSAGNAGTNNDTAPLDPASFNSPSILAVAASDESDGRASFSNYGATSVDLAAPGSSILSTYRGNYGFASGSSMAAPHVAGAAMLLASRNPTMSAATIKSQLMQSADVLPQWAGLSVSSGRLNLLNALAGTGNSLPVVSVTRPTPGSSFPRSTTVTIEATATDSDGTITQVEFFANGLAIGIDATGPGPYSVSWTPSLAGTYALTAIATDNDGATRESAAVTVTISPPSGRPNVALAVNGGVATASSTSSAKFPASAVVNGDRKGMNWGDGGGWNDGTKNAWPDWIEVQFSGVRTIEEIGVFTLQDSYTNPVEPTSTMTFTKYGLVDFSVDYWDGADWAPVPGGVVTNNNLVWRQLFFAPVTTSRIRVVVTNAKYNYSRLTEIEAYAVLGTFNLPPAVNVTSPAGGAEHAIGTTVPLAAAATDADGSIATVDFFVNTTQVGAGVDPDQDGTYTLQWSPTLPGTYTLTAVAADNLGAVRTSAPVIVKVTPPSGRANVALAAYGATVTASSTSNTNFPPSAVINGDRKGLNWGNGGGWNDGTNNVWPDWLEVQFDGVQTIEEIDVFTLQDSYGNPVEPTASTSFSKYGVVDFSVEYWTGSEWQPVPGAAAAGNNLVWRQFFFEPIVTSGIRVKVTNGKADYSRLVEVEAYAVLGTFNLPPTVTLTSPGIGTAATVPAEIPLSAIATDPDGAVSQVDFYANGVKLGTATGTTSLFSFTWPASVAGSYILTAVATDDDGKTTESAPVTITLVPPGGRVNVALLSAGATAVASSTRSSSYAPESTINGDRKGLNWGNGGGWHDWTSGAWPDWLEVQFNGERTIDEIDVFSIQDNYPNPSEPTLAMGFTRYGLQDFTVEYWTGSGWQAVTGGTVTNNNKVWRQFQFAAVTTSRIRIHITRALASYSRIAEVEAWGQP